MGGIDLTGEYFDRYLYILGIWGFGAVLEDDDHGARSFRIFPHELSLRRVEEDEKEQGALNLVTP